MRKYVYIIFTSVIVLTALPSHAHACGNPTLYFVGGALALLVLPIVLTLLGGGYLIIGRQKAFKAGIPMSDVKPWKRALRDIAILLICLFILVMPTLGCGTHIMLLPFIGVMGIFALFKAVDMFVWANSIRKNASFPEYFIGVKPKKLFLYGIALVVSAVLLGVSPFAMIQIGEAYKARYMMSKVKLKSEAGNAFSAVRKYLDEHPGDKRVDSLEELKVGGFSVSNEIRVVKVDMSRKDGEIVLESNWLKDRSRPYAVVISADGKWNYIKQ